MAEKTSVIVVWNTSVLFVFERGFPACSVVGNSCRSFGALFISREGLTKFNVVGVYFGVPPLFLML